MICYSDPYMDFLSHDAYQEERLNSLPQCDECGEPLQDDYCYKIDGEYICEECMSNHKISVDRLIGNR